MKKIDLKSTDKSFNQKLPDENVANFQIFIKGKETIFKKMYTLQGFVK